MPYNQVHRNVRILIFASDATTHKFCIVFKVKGFAFLQFQNIAEHKPMLMFQVYTLLNEGMSQDTDFSEEKNHKSRLKAVLFRISNLTVFIYHAKEEFYSQSSEELPVTRSGLNSLQQTEFSALSVFRR